MGTHRIKPSKGLPTLSPRPGRFPGILEVSRLILSCLLSGSLLPPLVLAALPMVTSCAVGRHERLVQVQALPLAQSQPWEARFIFPTVLAEAVWVHNEKKKKGIRCSATEGSRGSHSPSGVTHGAQPGSVSFIPVLSRSWGHHSEVVDGVHLLSPPTFLSYPPSTVLD